MRAIHLNILLLLLGLGGEVNSENTGEKEAVLFAVANPVVAYVVNSKQDAETTYLVACTKGASTEECGFNQPYTLIQGPKTAAWDYVAYSNGAEQALTMGCAIKGTTSMGCKVTGVAGKGPRTTETVTWTGAEATTRFRNIAVVTNTASLLTYTATASSSESEPSSTAVKSTQARESKTVASSSTAVKSTPAKESKSVLSSAAQSTTKTKTTTKTGAVFAEVSPTESFASFYSPHSSTSASTSIHRKVASTAAIEVAGESSTTTAPVTLTTSSSTPTGILAASSSVATVSANGAMSRSGGTTQGILIAGIAGFALVVGGL